MLPVLLLTAACQPDAPRDRQLHWTFTPLWSVGGATDSAVALSYLSPSDIVADDSGHIYVLGGVEQRVYVIDSDGRLIRTLGHEGQGPGEFESLDWIEATTRAT